LGDKEFDFRSNPHFVSTVEFNRFWGKNCIQTHENNVIIQRSSSLLRRGFGVIEESGKPLQEVTPNSSKYRGVGGVCENRSLHWRSDFSEETTVKKGVELLQDLVATETFNKYLQKLSNMRRLTA
jgi:hypothetical protein